jgi:hypothetical protein
MGRDQSRDRGDYRNYTPSLRARQSPSTGDTIDLVKIGTKLALFNSENVRIKSDLLDLQKKEGEKEALNDLYAYLEKKKNKKVRRN